MIDIELTLNGVPQQVRCTPGDSLLTVLRRLGCSPEIVARCARRLVDSGVWKNGRTVAAWIGEGIDHPTFWNDVAVAQGLLRRHIGEDGMLHWTPVGRWTPPQDREPGSPGGEPVGAGLRHGGWERPEFDPRVSAPPEQRRGDPIRRLFPDAQWME